MPTAARRLVSMLRRLGAVLDAAGDAPAVVRAALAHEGPVVVDVRTSLEHLSAFSTLSALASAGPPDQGSA